jgi:Protein of unknown function (DUF3275)
MQSFQAQLVVEEIVGRRSNFSVGTLITSLGPFKVEDSALDQFKAGTYTGTFLVEKIFSKGVPWRGGFFTKIIAKIAKDGYLIDEESDAPTHLSNPGQVEPDPVDDGASLGQTDVPTKSARPSLTKRQGHIAPTLEIGTMANLASQEPAIDQRSQDQTLFGIGLFEFFEQREELALDPSVDRAMFRQQRDRLKAVGYRFEAQNQRWLFQPVSA